MSFSSIQLASSAFSLLEFSVGKAAGDGSSELGQCSLFFPALLVSSRTAFGSLEGSSSALQLVDPEDGA